MVESIASNTKLTSLDISNNNIQDDGGGEFVDKLGDKNHTLVNLNLAGNQISESRMRILDMLLKHRKSSSSCATSKSKTDQIQEEKTNTASNSRYSGWSDGKGFTNSEGCDRNNGKQSYCKCRQGT